MRKKHATPDAHHEHVDQHAHHEHGGHDEHAGHDVEVFRRRFWVSLVLTLPTLIWGHMLQMAIGYEAPTFPGSDWIAPIFGVAVFAYGGRVFLAGGVREVRDRLPGMMTLISLALSVAFVFSLAVTLGFEGMPLWEELATLITIMLLGHWIEMRSIMQARGALQALAKLLPRTAIRLVGDRQEEIPLEKLADGDVVLVRPGAAIPADGVVQSGSSELDESMITGESRLVTKRDGDHVIAGTVNGSGSLRIQVTGTGERTALAGIMRLVERAQSSRSRAQALADRAAFFLTIVALGSAIITAVAWLLLGASAGFVIERVVTVLVIACPHALGLAIPLVIAISTTLGARSGLLVRNRRGLEEARLVDVVVFDKTGTLTLGQHRVVETAVADGINEADALALAASVEQDSEHPVARAIVTSARERDVSIPTATSFRALPGRGVEAVVSGRRLRVGGPNLIVSDGIRLSPALEGFRELASNRGQGAIFLLDDDRPLAAFAVADAVRPESREAVHLLQQSGIEVAMLTGDAKEVADSVANDLGIDIVFAEVLPEEKAQKIADLRRQGRRVAMVGDGVNDAPALAGADVGIAVGAGTEVAVEAGDIVLVRNDPRDVARIIELSRKSYRKMVENLWWAAGYNIVAIPLAAGVLAPWGVVLHPAIGAVLMSLSTVIVALNAQLLRRSASRSTTMIAQTS
jgi:Cu2+-exporting ATPase